MLVSHWDDEEVLENVRGPSKSRRKRESSALQDLGAELMDLSVTQLQALEVPAALLEAVLTGKSIKAHGGLARQRKYIGKLLRSIDVAPIQKALVMLRGESAEQVRLHHAAESWRERMILEADVAVNAFMSLHPASDRQALRHFAKEAARERSSGLPPRAARALYRCVMSVLGQRLSEEPSGESDA